MPDTEPPYLEAADRIANEELPQDYVDMFDNGARWAAKLLRRMADEAQHANPTADTLPAWLRQRFTASDVDWENLDDAERSYWEHQARAVRRAVARGGFKQPTAEARQ